MPKRTDISSILVFGAALGMGLALPNLAIAQDRIKQVAGWQLSDTGSRLGDDRDRWVGIEKGVPHIELVYSLGLTNAVGTIVLTFSACKGLEYNAAFDNPPTQRAAAIRKQVHEAFAEFARSCRIKPGSEVALMAGFDEAFAAVDKQVTDKPYILSPKPPSDGQGTADTKSQGQ
jgi:hypothetical protein